MRRVLIICLFLLLSKTAGECNTNILGPLQPMSVAYPVHSDGGNLANLPDALAGNAGNNFNVLGQIEQSLFGRSFANQNISNRLSRIEKSLFNTTYATSSDTQRLDNIISNFNQINKYPNISKNDLSRIESRILRQSYPQNSAVRRIERLEEQMFGAIQSGDVEARYEALKLASKNFANTQSAYNPPLRSGWKGAKGDWKANALNAIWGGSMTGFTPPINPFYGNNLNNMAGLNNDYTGYNNNSYNRYNQYPSGYGSYRGNRTNTGYSDDFQDFSARTGVTILD